MKLEEVANFCEFKDCEVELGSPEAGFLVVDGNGVKRPANNYRRYLAHNELSALPSAQTVLAGASTFRLRQQGQTREMDRQQFERELERFRRLVES